MTTQELTTAITLAVTTDTLRALQARTRIGRHRLHILQKRPIKITLMELVKLSRAGLLRVTITPTRTTAGVHRKDRNR